MNQFGKESSYKLLGHDSELAEGDHDASSFSSPHQGKDTPNWTQWILKHILFSLTILLLAVNAGLLATNIAFTRASHYGSSTCGPPSAATNAAAENIPSESVYGTKLEILRIYS